MSSKISYNLVTTAGEHDLDDEFKDTMLPITPLPPVNENEEFNSESDESDETDETKTNNNPYLSMRRANSFKIPSKKQINATDIKTTHLDKEEIELIESQINNIVSKIPFQMQVFNKIILQNSSISDSLSGTCGNHNDKISDEKQCEMLFKMIKISYKYIINKLYKSLEIAIRAHTKYDCVESDFICILDTILSELLAHKSIKWSEKQHSKTSICWNKLHIRLKEMIHKIYGKKLKRYMATINRTLPDNDIQCVVTIWNEQIMKNQKEVAAFLSDKLSEQTKFSNLFNKYDVNVSIEKGTLALLRMWDNTINMVSNKEKIIPHLKRLGLQHGKMGIKAQDLAIMKHILIDLVKEVMGFDYNESIKKSWNKVLTFYIGTMIQSLKDHQRSSMSLSRISMTQTMSRTNSMDSETGYKFDFEPYDINDIDDIHKHLTNEVIVTCQNSWKYLLTKMDKMTKLFYNELVNTSLYSSGVSQIFVNLNAENKLKQCKRMIVSIGSTAMLFDDIEKLVQILNELGKRHLYYKIKPQDFKHIKYVWFKVLKKAYTIKWNKKMKYSWNVVWDFSEYYMKSSLEDALLLYIPPDPVTVKFKVLINHIDRVKVSDLSFYADIWFAAYTGNNASQSYAFGDNYLNGKMNVSSNIPKNKSLPFGGIRCLNGMQISDRYRSLREPYIRYFKDNETWYLRGNIVGTFSQTFDLRSYPFDKHNIELLFALERDDTISSFDAENISVRMMPFKLDAMAGCNYNVYEPTIELIKNSGTKGGSSSGKKYTHCKIIIPISREYIHSIYNIMLPLAIIELAAFSIYFTDLFPITARLILSMTLLLTLVAFRRSITMSLPPTPYLTLIDHTFNSACLLSFLHIAGVCVINQFQHLPIQKCQIINLIIASFAFSIFCIVHVLISWKAKYYISLYPKYTVQQTYDNHDAMGMIARKIDKQMSMRSAQSNDDSMRSM